MVWLISTILIAGVVFYRMRLSGLAKAKLHDSKPPDLALIGTMAVLIGGVVALIPHAIFGDAIEAARKPKIVNAPSTQGPPSWEKAKTPGEYLSNPERDALTICQGRIRDADRTASMDVPAVGNFGTQGEFYFAWGAQTQFIRVTRDGRTEMASGSCIIDRAAGVLKSVTFNGKTII